MGKQGGRVKLKAWYDFQPSCIPYAKNARFMQLDKDWYYWIQFPGKLAKQVWIAYRFWYNGASIPRPFWFIMGSPFHPVYWAGAAGHDEGYSSHRFPRPVMDEILIQLVEQSNRELKAGLGGLRLHLIWSAVRVAGYPAWTNNAQDLRDLAEYRAMIAARPDRDKFEV
jgi:hypothetical protein